MTARVPLRWPSRTEGPTNLDALYESAAPAEQIMQKFQELIILKTMTQKGKESFFSQLSFLHVGKEMAIHVSA